MTGTAIGLRHFYEIHGIGVAVDARDPAVMEAIELRLRDFRRNEPAPVPCGVLFEFVAEAPQPPVGDSRPVYDMPDGSLHYFPAADAIFGEVGGATLCCEPSRGVARLHCTQFSGRELYLATHPLVTVSLMELLERRGLYSLHAGCLSEPHGRGVLLAGPSGAGKSTLALALARTGMGFLSDDVLFLESDADAAGLRVLGFADTVGITKSTATRFAELEPWLAKPPTDGFPKHLARIEDLFGSPSVAACRPRALVFPQVARGEASAIAPLDPRTALLALVPDVLLTDAAGTQAHLAAIATLLEQVECYVLRSGTDLDRAAEMVRELL